MKPSTDPIRWSLNRVAEETNISRQTVKNRMTRAGIEPDKDGYFSTQQVFAALYGDSNGEKLKKLAAERRIVELKLAEAERELIPAADVRATWTHLLSAMRATWLQLPAKAATNWPTWQDARACETWVTGQIREILEDLAVNQVYRRDTSTETERTDET